MMISSTTAPKSTPTINTVRPYIPALLKKVDELDATSVPKVVGNDGITRGMRGHPPKMPSFLRDDLCQLPQ